MSRLNNDDMNKKDVPRTEVGEPNKEKLYSVISYIYILWIAGWLSCRDNPKVMFHVNQGAILSVFVFTSMLCIKFISNVLYFIAPVLLIMSSLLQIIWIFFSLGLAGIGVYNAVTDSEHKLPFIGNLFVIFKQQDK